jgi:site-specific DNA-methyltransferase (adenine-specific)/site-specific DNA-methyltransferase (cytosine-N4-specific)
VVSHLPGYWNGASIPNGTHWRVASALQVASCSAVELGRLFVGSCPFDTDYIDKLVLVFREVHRVLTKDGTWLNIGDSYTSGGRTWRDSDKKNKGRGMSYRAPTPDGLKPKDLVGVPWRLAFALQADSWHLRSDIIWNKPNCQPESVKDRPTRAHEYLFLLTKSEKYYYDSEAINEPTTEKNGSKNRRTVWSINTTPFKDAHFAVFPPSLVKPCILAGSKENSIVLDKPILSLEEISNLFKDSA